jgi:hypothetical protein
MDLLDWHLFGRAMLIELAEALLLFAEQGREAAA